jgi:hypothetical protein
MERTTVSNIHVGCSGWVYKHWRGIFYPEGLPQKRWFERYAEEFDTVEINASFYRLPLASTFEGWRDKAPPGFHYAVKVNRFITHMKKLLDCETEVDRFIALARPARISISPSTAWRRASAGGTARRSILTRCLPERGPAARGGDDPSIRCFDKLSSYSG